MFYLCSKWPFLLPLFLGLEWPVSVTMRYKIKGMLGCGGIRTGELDKHSLILLNAPWHPWFHSVFAPFFKFLKMNSHTIVNFHINWIIYFKYPINPQISISVLSGYIFYIALIFEGSTPIPRKLTMYPSNLIKVTPNAHFYGSKHMLYFLSSVKNF